MASPLDTSPRAGVTDAFRDLLHALNPYLDAALPQSPRFHRFCDFPAELRFNIYEHYFRNERGALLTRSWPNIPQISVFVIEPRLDRKSQILPNVCFVDRAAGKEAISCLISVATLTLHWSTDIADISKLAAACHLNGIRIRDHIHNVSLTQINGCYLRWIYEGTMTHELDRARKANAKASTLLKNSCFDNLHQLSLTFHAPDCFEHIHDDSDDEEGIRRYRALPIDEFLQGFDLYSITRLERLQTVVFIAKTSKDVQIKEGFVEPLFDQQGEKMEHLQAVADMARQVKATFQARGQKVIVQVSLKLSDQSHDKTLQ